MGTMMNLGQDYFWAKTTADNQPGISVHDHCLNVGCVGEALLATLPPAVRALLPPGATTLVALHDVGKITLGFQAKCPAWLARPDVPTVSPGEVTLAVTDHALVSQVFLQEVLPSTAKLWAVAVGSHHGRVKGRNARIPQGTIEPLAEWAETHRKATTEALHAVFGDLPTTSPEARFAPHHSDLWLLAGLITVADWIGSNETWFAPNHGLPPEAARQKARVALAQIGWPGGKLKATDFGAAFASGQSPAFTPNAVQWDVAAATQGPGIVIVEGPMGCGKTEAALFAAQQLIASGSNHGIYFALPTQVTSNRIHQRIGAFLRNTLADAAPLRLAHGNAWLEDDFDLRLRPAFSEGDRDKEDDPCESIREARSWFASAKQALLATYGVGTIDQALQGVVAVKHFFVRRFALAGKVVILDEVHSYDIYTGTLITALIRELVNLRCSVIILSATLTAERRRDLLAAAEIKETEPPTAYPLVTVGAKPSAATSPRNGNHARPSRFARPPFPRTKPAPNSSAAPKPASTSSGFATPSSKRSNPFATCAARFAKEQSASACCTAVSPFNAAWNWRRTGWNFLAKTGPPPARAQSSSPPRSSSKAWTLIWISSSPISRPRTCCSNAWAGSGGTNARTAPPPRPNSGCACRNCPLKRMRTHSRSRSVAAPASMRLTFCSARWKSGGNSS